MSNPPLFEYIKPPQFRLKAPDAVLTEQDYDRLKILVEDFRFVTDDVTEDLSTVAAEVRSRSTILRRLLCVERDLFKAGKWFSPKSELRVRARMLDFEPTHPAIIVSCGNYPWVRDRLPGTALEFSIRGVPPLKEDTESWQYRENADVSLAEYLDGLAIAVLGTRIRRWQVIKYVADKKAAHVSEKRKNLEERALDRAWSVLVTHIHASNGPRVSLNVAYLETLAVIRTLAESESINSYVDQLAAWLDTAEIGFGSDVRPLGMSFPVDPIT